MTTFTISGAELHAAAAWIARFSPSRPTVPILGNVLIDAADDAVRCTASDFELTGTVIAPADVHTPGRVLVSARLLAAIAKTLPRTGTVQVRADQDGVVLACGASSWTLPGADAEDYPPLPASGEPVAEIGAAELTRALARVLPAASRDPGLPALRGVCLREDAEGLLTLAATDRYRLAVATLAWQPTTDGELGELVAPAELFDALRRVIPPDGEPVRLHATDNTLSVATTRHTVTGRRVAEAFPNYRLLLDGAAQPTVGTATVAVAELAQAAERAATVAAEDNQPLRLDFDAQQVQLSAAAEGHGHTEHTAPLLGYQGEPVAAGFNARYLQDALACLDAPTAVLSLRGGTRPMLLRPARTDGDPDLGYVHLLCPMRLTDTTPRPAAA